MARKLKDQLVGLDPNFRYRGVNQTRIETFSDAVFALAITLTVLSSSVPETFADLKLSMNDIIPFLFCVVLLIVIWSQHYLFFLRYGLQDAQTIVYNTFLLFMVLVYVYPLKFLMRFLVSFYAALITGDSTHLNNQYLQMQQGDMRYLMVMYGLGAALIFFTVTILYRHAFSRRKVLGLDEYEIFSTRSGMYVNLLLGVVPFLSFLVALIGRDHYVTYLISGLMYLIYPVVMPLFGWLRSKRSRTLFPKLYKSIA